MLVSNEKLVEAFCMELGLSEDRVTLEYLKNPETSYGSLKFTIRDSRGEFLIDIEMYNQFRSLSAFKKYLKSFSNVVLEDLLKKSF